MTEDLLDKVRAANAQSVQNAIAHGTTPPLSTDDDAEDDGDE